MPQSQPQSTMPPESVPGRVHPIDGQTDVPTDRRLRDLATAAATARSLADKYTAAITAQHDAKADLLIRALAAVAPARPVIVAPIPCRRTMWVDTSRPDEVAYFPQRGLVLSGRREQEGNVGAASGQYGGAALVLWEDNTIAELIYSGRWTRWSGEPDYYGCSAEPVTAQEAMTRWPLDECVAKLASALAKRASACSPEHAAWARLHAERLTELAKLVG